jgi:hypothetical protein
MIRIYSLRSTRLVPALLGVVLLCSYSADWPSFRHNSLRTGGQLNHGPLTDPAKVATLAISWTFPSGVVPNPLLGRFGLHPSFTRAWST